MHFQIDGNMFDSSVVFSQRTWNSKFNDVSNQPVSMNLADDSAGTWALLKPSFRLMDIFVTTNKKYYDLYSKTIKECCGASQVYTYAYDEPLFPGVLSSMDCSKVNEKNTYMHISLSLATSYSDAMYTDVNKLLGMNYSDDKYVPSTFTIKQDSKYNELFTKPTGLAKIYDHVEGSVPFIVWIYRTRKLEYRKGEQNSLNLQTSQVSLQKRWKG